VAGRWQRPRHAGVAPHRTAPPADVCMQHRACVRVYTLWCHGAHYTVTYCIYLQARLSSQSAGHRSLVRSITQGDLEKNAMAMQIREQEQLIAELRVSGAEQSTEQHRAGQCRTGQDRAGQCRTVECSRARYSTERLCAPSSIQSAHSCIYLLQYSLSK
jgi:uncharacterized protein (DUF2237 family)